MIVISRVFFFVYIGVPGGPERQCTKVLERVAPMVEIARSAGRCSIELFIGALKRCSNLSCPEHRVLDVNNLKLMRGSLI